MPQWSASELVSLPAPGLPRRLGAILYDSMLLLGVLIAGAAVAELLVGFAGGEVSGLDPVWYGLYQFWLWGLLPGLFFIYFWIHGGQTLGMKAWRLRVIREDGLSLDINDGFTRYLLGWLSLLVFGLGFLWSLWPPHRAWHDKGSATRLALMPKSVPDPLE